MGLPPINLSDNEKFMYPQPCLQTPDGQRDRPDKKGAPPGPAGPRGAAAPHGVKPVRFKRSIR